jgi:hypothetical protein
VGGWSSGELRLNEKKKTQLQIWIITIDIRNKKKEVGVLKTWT